MIFQICLYSTLLVLMILSFKSSLKIIKNHGYSYFGFLKEIYLKKTSSYLYAFVLVLFLISFASIVAVNIENMPSFLKWSWLSIFNEQPTNVIGKPILDSKIIFGGYQSLFLGTFWVFLILALPLFAYTEEVSFRSLKTEKMNIIKNS